MPMRLLLLCLTMCLLACSKKATNNTSSVIKEDNLNKTVEEVLGTNTEKIFNTTKDLLLAKQIGLPETSVVRFIVIQTSNGKIIHQGSFKPGYVQWKTNDSLELFNVPGIIPAHKTQADYISIIALSRLSKQ